MLIQDDVKKIQNCIQKGFSTSNPKTISIAIGGARKIPLVASCLKENVPTLIEAIVSEDGPVSGSSILSGLMLKGCVALEGENIKILE